MAYIEERKTADGKTSYRVQVRLKGYAVECATFAGITAAKKWAASTESAMREGRYFKGSEARRHTFAQLADRYIAEVIPRKSAPQQPRQTAQLLWWKEKLGHLVLADLTAAAIVGARDGLAAEVLHKTESAKRPRSAASVNRYLAALSHALNVAVREWGGPRSTRWRRCPACASRPGGFAS